MERRGGRVDDVESGFLETNYAELNQEYYSASPWEYLEFRLASLMLVASDSPKYRAALAQPLSLGAFSMEFAFDARGTYPSPEQSYTAVEAEVLLHHAAETLLRFVHAHAEPDPCPWLRMSRMKSAYEFKQWVRDHIMKAPAEAITALAERVFHCDLDCPPEPHAQYLRIFAEHFLDAAPYNAAKHGMALTGGSERLEVRIDGKTFYRREGATVSWLAVRPTDVGPRWTLVSRQFAPEVFASLVSVAIGLMRSIWAQGRAEHGGEPWRRVYWAVSPERLFTASGVRTAVLAEFHRRLAYIGERQTLTLRTAHPDASSFLSAQSPEE